MISGMTIHSRFPGNRNIRSRCAGWRRGQKPERESVYAAKAARHRGRSCVAVFLLAGIRTDAPGSIWPDYEMGVEQMRDAFVRTLMELAKEDKKIELVTGDLGFGVLKPFWEQLPDQFTNAGIAEQNMTSLAAGMALEGKTVFTYSIGNFPTLRCLEQIRNDCAYHRANVKIVCVGGGFVYGSLGMSHQATEDLAVMRALPDVVVMAPGDLVEAEECTKAIARYQGTGYLRLGRGGERRIHKRLDGFEIGKAVKVHDGERVVIFSTGAIFDEVADAYEMLVKKGYRPAVYTFPTVKPIDTQIIEQCSKAYEWIVTVEEHNVVAGFGSAVAEIMAEMNGRAARLMRIGLQDEYNILVGNQKYLREQYKLDGKSIANEIEKNLSCVEREY